MNEPLVGQVAVESHNNFNFNKAFRYVISFFVFLIPVFFLPINGLSIYSSKISLITTFVVAIGLLLFIKIFYTKSLTLPKSKTLLVLLILPICALVSSFLSTNLTQSVVGVVVDLGTSGFFVVLAILTFFIISSLDKDNLNTAKNIICSFLLSSGFIVFYFLLNIFLTYIPSSIKTWMPALLLGGYIDLAIILTASIIASVFYLSISGLNKKIKYFLNIFVVCATFIVGSINFVPIIYILVVLSLLYLVYNFSISVSLQNNKSESIATSNRKIIYLPFFILIFSILILLPGNKLPSFLAGIFKVNAIEVRPNFNITQNIIKESWIRNPIVGVGPNKFSDLWNLYKPLEVNTADFWNYEFKFGSSLFTTLAVTTGPLGVLSLLIFILLYLLLGYKSLHKKQDNQDYVISNIYFLTSLLFWVTCFIYTPGIEVLSLCLIFTGVFIATLVPRGLLESKEFKLLRGSKNFLQILILLILAIALIFSGFIVIRKNVSNLLFNNAVVSMARGDIESAKSQVVSAIKINPLDLYWRSLSEITLVELSKSLEGVSSPQNIDSVKMVEIQNIVSNSIQSAKSAVSLNDTDYKNWINLARVYESLASVGVEGAIQNAKDSYLEAQKRMPNSPEIPLSLARIEMISGHNTAAKDYIAESIKLKNNYTDAYFILARIEVASNNVKEAIHSIELATIADPNNYNLYLQLGLLKYNNNDFYGAITAFEKVIMLIPDYANAKYFLGLSYEKVGKTQEAIKQFKDIQLTNPDNQAVALIIKNLESGFRPFHDSTPPIDDTPEDADSLPLN